jgi:DNA primase
VSLRDEIRAQFEVFGELGDELLVVCPSPEHDDSNPSAYINVRKRVWFCQSCQASGHLEELLDGRIADEAVEDMLTEIAGALTPQHRPASFPERWLDQFDAAGVHPYWQGRGLSEPLCREFRLGYDPGSGRATYPLRSPGGAVLGVVRRSTRSDQRPKYRYPDGVKISETLFGYYKVRQGIRDIVLVEGALDALAMWDVGIPAVAQLGATLSRTQVRLLQGLGLRTLTLAYDQDASGRAAVERAIVNPRLNFCPLRLMTWSPTQGKDPLELTTAEREYAYDTAKVIFGGW